MRVSDRLVVWIVAAVLLLMLCARVAEGQVVCHERAETLDYLRQNYAEVPVAIGLANNGAVLEVLAAPDGKSWTILLSTPEGHTCPVASGIDWEAVEARPGTGG